MNEIVIAIRVLGVAIGVIGAILLGLDQAFPDRKKEGVKINKVALAGTILLACAFPLQLIGL
jgi:hypothetical protein